MLVYRITLEKYCHQLFAPGTEGRWNSRGYFIIYTAGSRALACLENLVHRDSEGLKSLFKVIVIDIPAQVEITALPVEELHKNWTMAENLFRTRQIGNNWLSSLTSCVIKVPSAIIPGEFNFLINPAHRDFAKISIKNLEEFEFDSRLK